jgi:acetyltransferase-like isoleucine patch superfamily enzyme
MRILKYLWFHSVAVATSWLPDLRPILKMRGFLSRPAFKKCGKNLQIARRVTINFTNCLEIGADVFLSSGCWLQARGGIVLEDGVQLGPYSVLVTGNHTQVEGSFRFGPSSLAPIRIGRGAWVAAHATVTKGVTVGRGAVLAANSVATRDIPSFTVAGGVPARIMRQATPSEVFKGATGPGELTPI